VLLAKYYNSEHMKKNEMGGTYDDTYRREERFGGGKHKGKKNFGDPRACNGLIWLRIETHFGF